MSMIPQSQNVDYDSLWKKSLVRVTDEFSLPPVILQVDDAIIGTLGNFSASTAKPRQRRPLMFLPSLQPHLLMDRY